MFPPVLSAPKISVSFTILGEKILKFTVQMETCLGFLLKQRSRLALVCRKRSTKPRFRSRSVLV